MKCWAYFWCSWPLLLPHQCILKGIYLATYSWLQPTVQVLLMHNTLCSYVLKSDSHTFDCTYLHFNMLGSVYIYLWTPCRSQGTMWAIIVWGWALPLHVGRRLSGVSAAAATERRKMCVDQHRIPPEGFSWSRGQSETQLSSEFFSSWKAICPSLTLSWPTLPSKASRGDTNGCFLHPGASSNRASLLQPGIISGGVTLIEVDSTV